MKLRNSIYYTPYKILEKKKISFADFAQKKNYYNQLAFLFEEASTRNIYTKQEVEFVIKIISLYTRRPNSFLDVACGSGRHDRILSQKGFSVVGIDISSNLLKLARLRDRRTTYKKADMRSFDLGKQFDCILSLWDAYTYLSQPKDMRSFLNKCHKHLKPGGLIILDSRNFFKRDVEGRIEQRNFLAGDYDVNLIIRRNTNLKDKVHEAIYVYILIHRKKEEHFVIFDQELVRIYPLSDLSKYFGSRFQIIRLFGDFDLKQNYNEQSSKRLIIVAQKK